MDEALEKYANSLITDQCFKAYESLMKPFENFKGKDVQIEGLLLTARVSYDINYYIIEASWEIPTFLGEFNSDCSNGSLHGIEYLLLGELKFYCHCERDGKLQ